MISWLTKMHYFPARKIKCLAIATSCSIGALIVVVGVLGYNLYQDKRQPEGLQINVGPNGVKIQGK